jgi:hypothetical protein
MLLYTALSPRPFKTIRLRPRQLGCRGCPAAPPTASLDKLSFSNILADIKTLEDDYNEFCGDLEGTTGPEDPLRSGMNPGEPGTRVNVQVSEPCYLALL